MESFVNFYLPIFAILYILGTIVFMVHVVFRGKKQNRLLKRIHHLEDKIINGEDMADVYIDMAIISGEIKDESIRREFNRVCQMAYHKYGQKF